jgi:hypothetical protein
VSPFRRFQDLQESRGLGCLPKTPNPDRTIQEGSRFKGRGMPGMTGKDGKAVGEDRQTRPTLLRTGRLFRSSDEAENGHSEARIRGLETASKPATFFASGKRAPSRSRRGGGTLRKNLFPGAFFSFCGGQKLLDSHQCALPSNLPGGRCVFCR